jgi:L-lactate dehydrogenase
METNTQQYHKRKQKVTVVGCGQVGMACIYSLLVREEVANITIADIDRKKLLGEVMDLTHAGAFITANVSAAGENYEGTEDSDLIILTAGCRQREGEDRRSLLDRNVSVFKTIVPPLVKKSPNTLVLVVSNPCDTLTYITWKLSGLPSSQVFGSGTYLDSSRFRVGLSKKFGVNAQSIHGWILGEHGDSSVPVWSGVSIGGLSMEDAMKHFKLDLTSKDFDQIYQDVKDSAAQVIQNKGYTNWAIGAAVCRIVEFIFHDSKRIVPLSTLVPEGAHGIKGEVFLSLPCVLGENGISRVITQTLTKEEEAKLQKSANDMLELQSKLSNLNSNPSNL